MLLEWSVSFLARASHPSDEAEASPRSSAALDVEILSCAPASPNGVRLVEFDDASFG